MVRFGTIFASSAFHDSTVNDCGNYKGKHFLHDYFIENRVILYFSGVRGVERYEHASLAASLKKKLMLKKKNNYHTVCS